MLQADAAIADFLCYFLSRCLSCCFSYLSIDDIAFTSLMLLSRHCRRQRFAFLSFSLSIIFFMLLSPLFDYYMA